MPLEQACLANLAKAATHTVTPNDLTIFGSDGKRILTYAAAPVVPITTGTFRVTPLNNGKGGVESVPVGVDLRATFGADGTVSGSSGCGTSGGPCTITGDRIQIGPPATTREACQDDAMTLETTYLTDLQPDATLESSATDLRFRNAGGATQVVFVRR
jgi:heat shock protein HslJ